MCRVYKVKSQQTEKNSNNHNNKEINEELRVFILIHAHLIK